jgi:hypothetical protein
VLRFLILAHRGDATAMLVASHLLTRHRRESVRIVLADEIMSTAQLVHRVNGAKALTSLRLADGFSIKNDGIGIVFNRLRYVEIPRFARANMVDQEYAALELFACLISWMKSLTCPVFGAPSSQSLGGPTLSTLAWNVLAGKAGLPTSLVRFTSSLKYYSLQGTSKYPIGNSVNGDVPAILSHQPGAPGIAVAVIGERVIGPVPHDLKAGCLRLAKLSGFEVLVVYFSTEENNLMFGSVDAYPQLTDAQSINAVVNTLEERS